MFAKSSLSDNARLTLRVCLWNALFYAAVGTAFVHYSSGGGMPAAGDDDARMQFAEQLLHGEELLERLRAGGAVLYVRHFETTHLDVADDIYQSRHIDLPLEMFADCSWQRPLSDRGVAHAGQVRDAMRSLGVALGPVFSSPYCRIVESALGLWGRMPQIDQRLIYRKGNYSEADANARVSGYLAMEPEPGRNLAVVGHRPPMDGTGFTIGEGEMFVFAILPGDETPTMIGHITVTDWLRAAAGDIASFGSRKPEAIRIGQSRYWAHPRDEYPPIEEVLEAK